MNDLSEKGLDRLKDVQFDREYLIKLTENFNRAKSCEAHQKAREFINIENAEFICYMCSYEKKLRPEALVTEGELKAFLLQRIKRNNVEKEEYDKNYIKITDCLRETEEMCQKLKDMILTTKKELINLIEARASKAIEGLESEFAKETDFLRRSLSSLEFVGPFLKNHEEGNFEKILDLYKFQEEMSQSTFNFLISNPGLVPETEKHFESSRSGFADLVDQTFVSIKNFFFLDKSFRIGRNPAFFAYPGSSNWGAIMTDPARQDSKIFFKDCYNVKTQIAIYDNIEALKNKSASKTLELGTTVVGTFPCVFKNYLYACREWGSSVIVKVNLSNIKDKKHLELEGIVNNKNCTDWGGYNHVIFCCDSANVYIIYTKLADSCLYLSILDEASFTISSTIKLPTEIKSFSSLMIIEGALYGFVDSSRAPNALIFKYDIKRNIVGKVDVEFENRGSCSSSLHYNHQTRELWTVSSDKNFYRYKVNFICGNN